MPWLRKSGISSLLVGSLYDPRLPAPATVSVLVTQVLDVLSVVGQVYDQRLPALR